jgi:hypothetical protein
MCDAFGVHVQEVASTLDLTSVTVRTVLQNARRKMEGYDGAYQAPTREAQAQVAGLLRDCLAHVQGFDAPRLEKIMADDAQARFDSGGEFVAPSGTVVGSSTVAKLLTKFANGTGPISFAFRMLNGLPAALGHSKGRPRWAKRFVLLIDTREGLISEIHIVLATAKLTAIRFEPV